MRSGGLWRERLFCRWSAGCGFVCVYCAVMSARAGYVLALLLALMLIWSWAYAETIPATTQAQEQAIVLDHPAHVSGACGAPDNSGWHGTDSAALCAQQAAWVAGEYSQCPGWGTAPTLTLANDIGCYYSDGGHNDWTRSCPSGYTVTAVDATHFKCVAPSVYTCPANGGWSLSGSNCVRADCAPGEIRDSATGQCLLSCPAGQTLNDVGACVTTCTTALVRAKAPGPTFTINGSSGVICIPVGGGQGCTALQGGGWGYQRPNGSWFSTFDASGITATGTSCDPSGSNNPANAVPPETPASCGPNKCWGSVNGVGTCVACEGASTSGSKTTTSTGAGGDKTVTTTTTTTSVGGPGSGAGTSATAPGAVVTTSSTTTTTTTNAQGQQTGTSTTTQTGSQSGADFCRENPHSALCGGADCQAGDDRVACMSVGIAPQAENLAVINVGPSAITPALTSSGSCPSDVVLRNGVVFSFAGVCNAMGMIRAVVILAAWLAAAGIVFGWRTGGGD